MAKRNTTSVATGSHSRIVTPELRVPSLDRLPAACLRSMLMHGKTVLECERVLKRGGINLVSEVLREQGPFVEYEHYPNNDVYDNESRSQYYFHSHRSEHEEHGHFHTFIRPVTTGIAAGSGESDGNIVHLVAISMDDYGWPIGLFATNLWVSGGLWRDAGETIQLLKQFNVDHAWPSWPVNRWIGSLLGLYQPFVAALLHHRDATIDAWSTANPQDQVLENRNLEITGYLPIEVGALVEQLDMHLRLAGIAQ